MTFCINLGSLDFCFKAFSYFFCDFIIIIIMMMVVIIIIIISFNTILFCQKCFVDNKTPPDFSSVWEWLMRDGKWSINFPELTATCPKIKYINIYFLLCYYRQKFSRHPLYRVWFVQLNGFEEEQEDEEDVEGLRTCAVRADLVH